MDKSTTQSSEKVKAATAEALRLADHISDIVKKQKQECPKNQQK